jgi:hypothetical protein
VDNFGQTTTALQTQFKASVAQLRAQYHKEQEELIEQVNQLQESLRQEKESNASHGQESPAHKRSHVSGEVLSSGTTEATQLLAASVKKRAVVDVEAISASLASPSKNTGPTEQEARVPATNSKTDVCTPFARPVTFVIDQAVSELKQLSKTMNETLMNEFADENYENAPSSPVRTDTTASAMKKTMSGDVVKLRKMTDEVDRLKGELECAMKQIHMQDQLIHQGKASLVFHLMYSR